MDKPIFMGKPLSYWVELDLRMMGSPPEVIDLIIEIAEMRGKISFYEARITQMSMFMDCKNGGDK